MGLLSEGQPLSWEETQHLAEHVKAHGVLQFVSLYRNLKSRKRDALRWGDEIEFMLIKFDHKKREVYVRLRAAEILNTLITNLDDESPALWRPEYASYMVEGIPSKPYECMAKHISTIEVSMKQRREAITKLLEDDEAVITLTNFPRLGCPDFTSPAATPTPKDGASRSLFFPDEAIYLAHPRFKTLTTNIRERRGQKVVINVPIFKDENTRSPFVEDFTVYGDDGEALGESLPDHVYMDAMGFGMGCCCVQVTFQACDMNEARLLYDQLAPFAPIMLAVCAASPFYRGYITEFDCRWHIISCSVDDRTREERGEMPLKHNKFYISKSRFSSISTYISEGSDEYNNTKLEYDEAIYNQMRDSGVDHLMARHVAHLFIRDTISLFSEKVYQDDLRESDHFENIQSTNWQTLRFKPPPATEPSIGWRVEFRPCDIQLTDFENAAVVTFMVLITRAILSFKLNFLIPISKVEENMTRSFKRDAILRKKFFFRFDIHSAETYIKPPKGKKTSTLTAEEAFREPYMEMTINEIMNGKDDIFPGLIPIINNFVSSMDIDTESQCAIRRHLKLIQARASGELPTPAAFLRNFVRNHPDYKKDSVVSERITYDLLNEIANIENGGKDCPDLLGKLSSPDVKITDADLKVGKRDKLLGEMSSSKRSKDITHKGKKHEKAERKVSSQEKILEDISLSKEADKM